MSTENTKSLNLDHDNNGMNVNSGQLGDDKIDNRQESSNKTWLESRWRYRLSRPRFLAAISSLQPKAGSVT